ncbi:MAG: hypothetical protein MUE84_09925 [Hyphomonas sp.]|nr:hypothetical protein [Hyphomonas sp.]
MFVTETKQFAHATERVLSNSVRADPSGDREMDNEIKSILMESARRNLRLERTDLSSGVTVVAYRLGGRTNFSSIAGPANYLMSVAICVNETLYDNPSASVPRLIAQPCKWRRLEINAVCIARRDLQALADAMFSMNIAEGLRFRIENDVTDATPQLDTAAHDPSRRLVLAPQHP